VRRNNGPTHGDRHAIASDPPGARWWVRLPVSATTAASSRSRPRQEDHPRQGQRLANVSRGSRLHGWRTESRQPHRHRYGRDTCRVNQDGSQAARAQHACTAWQSRSRGRQAQERSLTSRATSGRRVVDTWFDDDRCVVAAVQTRSPSSPGRAPVTAPDSFEDHPRSAIVRQSPSHLPLQGARRMPGDW
jgi:hypothetical protein